jgi:hypothetical protein
MRKSTALLLVEAMIDYMNAPHINDLYAEVLALPDAVEVPAPVQPSDKGTAEQNIPPETI